jgi:hypothetical protein
MSTTLLLSPLPPAQTHQQAAACKWLLKARLFPTRPNTTNTLNNATLNVNQTKSQTAFIAACEYGQSLTRQ